MKDYFKIFYKYLQKDSWDSFLVSLILIVLSIKLVLFPLLSLITGSPLPLVVVESCSMYHTSSFENWWSQNAAWYEEKGITEEEFKEYSLKNGFNKGDIILIVGSEKYEKGDIIVFNPNQDALSNKPIIHRIISEEPIATKGDYNSDQLRKDNNNQKIDETKIYPQQIIGKSVIKIPLLGWIKLIFFEPFKPENERGLCK
jgi:signal peptidase I